MNQITMPVKMEDPDHDLNLVLGLDGATRVLASSFLSFDSFSPADADFTCVHMCNVEGRRRCKNRVNKGDRETAVHLRSTVKLLKGPEKGSWQLLREYAKLCCCKQSHRPKAETLGYLDKAASDWLAELFGALSVTLGVNSKSTESARFLPYEQKGLKNELWYILSLPLRESEFHDGALYIFEREKDLGHVKIGFTTMVADDRFVSFESLCGFIPIPLRQIRHVPCIRRTERLVHSELGQHRKYCTTCVNNPNCRTLHSEWFEVGKRHAMEIMGRWARWMTEADPYEVDGSLKTYWDWIFKGLKARHQLLASKEVLEIWERQRAQDDLLVKRLESLSLKKNLLA